MRHLLIAVCCLLFTPTLCAGQGTTNFPDSIDDSLSLPVLVDNRFATLTASLSAAATVVPVISTAGFPDEGIIVIESEQIAYLGKTINSFTDLTRGFAGTIARPHSRNMTVRMPIVASHITGIRGATLALERKVGAGAGDAVDAMTDDVLTVLSDGSTGWRAPTGGGGGGGAVDAVFGRTGTVVAATNDYTWAQINKATSSLADITTRNASALTEDSTHRFATDTEKSTWNGKQDALGFTAVPNTRTVNGQALSANVSVTASDVGLGSVDNTSDAGKPVSTAQQTALDLKANLASPTFTGTVGGITNSMVGLGNVINADTTTTANITDSTNKRFITDTQQTVLGNTSGTNTGDQSAASLGLVIGTDVEAWDADLDIWAGKTVPSGAVVGTSDSQSLTNKKLGSLTSNGFVKTSGGDGTLSVDTSTYLTGNQTVTLSGDVSGSGATAITTTLATVASAGTTGSSSAIPVITINAKGLTTGITTAAVVAPAGTLTGATLASGVTGSSLTSTGTLTSGAIGTGFTERRGVFVTHCSGTASANTTIYLFPIGQIVSLLCTTTAASAGVPMPAAGTVRNLFFKSGTGGKAGDAVTILKNTSATGMPTCTYGTGTTCSDTATAGTVAAGDLITVRVTTSTTDTTANIHVTFELWN